jgi:hypothetical protein
VMKHLHALSARRRSVTNVLHRHVIRSPFECAALVEWI